jgi:hypothetical protein
LLTMLAFAFLQHLRLREKAVDPIGAGPPQPSLLAVRHRIALAFTRVRLRCPHCRQRITSHRPP